MRNERSIFSSLTMPVLLLLVIAAIAVADSVEVPSTFTPGTVADANAVNANFTALADAINDNDTRISANQANVGTNQTDIAGNAGGIAAHGARLSTNETDIATNQTDIATNQTDIATNQTDIATNQTDIATNETDIATNESDVTDHETRIGAIETGSPVTGLDADKLDGFHANGLARATYTHVITGADDWTSSSYATFVSKSVTVPSSGILLIWGKTEASWDIDSTASTYAWLQTRITVGGTEVGTTGTQEYFDNAIGLDMSVLAVSVAVPVSSGSTTVALEGRVYAGNAYLYLGYRSLMTLFVPFGNAGTQGTMSSAGYSASSTSSDNSTPPLPEVPIR